MEAGVLENITGSKKLLNETPTPYSEPRNEAAANPLFRRVSIAFPSPLSSRECDAINYAPAIRALFSAKKDTRLHTETLIYSRQPLINSAPFLTSPRVR